MMPRKVEFGARVVTVTVVCPDELGPAEVTRWKALQATEQQFDNPFLSPEFACAVGRVRADARVAVLEQAHGIVGFLPFHRGARNVGRPIGMGLADRNGLVCEAGLDWDARSVVRACGLRRWEFDHLLADQTPFVAHHRSRSRSPVIDLSQGWAGYVEERRQRSSTLLPTEARKQRRLAREVGPVRCTWEAADPEALALLLQWKSAQYLRSGEWDRFAHPWIVRLLEELLAIQTRDFAGSLYTVHAGDRLAAVHLGLRTRHALAWWLPAYDVELARHSPGMSLLVTMAADAANRDVRSIDLGKGAESFKERVKSGDLPVAEGWVAASATAGATKALTTGSRALLMKAPPSLRGLPRRLRKTVNTRRTRTAGA